MSKLRLEGIEKTLDRIRPNPRRRQTREADDRQPPESGPFERLVQLDRLIHPLPDDSPDEQPLADNDARMQVAPGDHEQRQEPWKGPASHAVIVQPAG